VDSRIQVQLEEDGGGSTRQSWMETKWSVAHVPLEVTRHKSSKSCQNSKSLIIRVQSVLMSINFTQCLIGVSLVQLYDMHQAQ